MAGVLGLDPTQTDLTPKEMDWMIRAKRMEEWDHTAALLSKIHNILVTKPADRKLPDDFHLPKLAEKLSKSPKRKVSLQDFKRLHERGEIDKWEPMPTIFDPAGPSLKSAGTTKN